MVSNQVSVDLEVNNTDESSSVATEQIKMRLDFNEREKSLTLTVLESLLDHRGLCFERNLIELKITGFF